MKNVERSSGERERGARNATGAAGAGGGHERELFLSLGDGNALNTIALDLRSRKIIKIGPVPRPKWHSGGRERGRDRPLRGMVLRTRGCRCE
jgi:hypothetical protein